MSETDWVVKAKRIGDRYEHDDFSDATEPLHIVCIIVEDPEQRGGNVTASGEGPTEQAAARDAVLRCRAFADRVRGGA